MKPENLPLDEQLAHLRTVLSTNKTLLEVLERAATLSLPNWYLAGGAPSQTIWNFVSGKSPETDIHDYDLVYFDGADLSYEAEDAAIRAGERVFAGLDADVEIRNQARVHLWYERRFGGRCPAHASVEAGIDSWISTSAMIGVRLEEPGGGGAWKVYAPRGLSEFFRMVVRPNPQVGRRESYEEKARRWMDIWEGLTVMPWPSEADETPLRLPDADAVQGS